MNDVQKHYDLLLKSGNDPVLDPAPLRRYMEGWDGDIFLQALALTSENSVLEIGVGTGRIALRVASQCRTFVGIDLAPETLKRAAEHLSEFSSVRLLCGDFMTYAFSERFDVIYSSLTFMHIEHKQEAMKRAFDLLCDGGRFVLSIDKNRESVIDAGVSRIAIFPDDPEETEAYLRLAGFHCVTRLETAFAYIFVSDK